MTPPVDPTPQSPRVSPSPSRPRGVDRIVEHRNKVAAAYFPDEVFGEPGLRFIQTEYPLAAATSRSGASKKTAVPWRADLLFLDADGRYLVIELKAGRLARLRGLAALDQVAAYRSLLEEGHGPAGADRFRFAVASDGAPCREVVDRAAATGLEIYTIPADLRNREPESKVVPNRLRLSEAAALRPQLVYSLPEALSAWRTSPAVRALAEEATRTFLDLFPEHDLEIDTKAGLRDLATAQARLNFVCPFPFWKRLAQIDVGKTGLTFKLKVDAVDNVFARRKLAGDIVRAYDRLLDTVNWDMKHAWTHQLRIEDRHALGRLQPALRRLRQDVDSLWRVDLRRAPEAAPAAVDEGEDDYWDPRGDE